MSEAGPRPLVARSSLDSLSPANPSPGSSSLVGAVLFYTFASLRNRLRVQLRRLRSPRALVAVAAGAAYVWWFLVRPVREDGFTPALAAGPWPPRVAALGLTLLAAVWWLARPAGGSGVGTTPGGRGASGGPARALAFTPAEEHLLFPAPVSRQGLVRWKLWRAQVGILVNALIWTVLLRGEGAQPGAWRRAAAVWVVLSVLFLHRLGAALVTGGWQARAAEADDAALDAASPNGAGPTSATAGDGGWRPWRLWRLAPAAVFAAVAGALLAGAVREQARLTAAWDVGLLDFLAVVGAALDHPAARAALWPARAVTAPLFAAPEGLAAWGQAMAPALALLALHYLWVLRTDAAVQEIALAAGERRRGTLAGTGAGDAFTAPARPRRYARRRAPALAPVGRPGVALVWKNLVAAARAVALARVLALYAVVAAGVLAVAVRTPRLAEVAGIVAGVWGAMLVVAGPTWVRVDLRHDLVHLPFLRAAPLSGRAVVAAEVTASVLALTGLQVAAFALLGLASLGARDGFGFTGEERLAGALALALALPGMNAALLTVHNAAALLFPAWVRAPGATRGVEAMGQNLVLTALTIAAAALVLAPAAFAGGAVWWGVTRLTSGAAGPWALAPAALAGTAAALVVLAPVVAWLGRVFDRTDPPAVDAQG